MSDAISTEGRVFVAQLTRDLAARERTGAALLSPGTTHWIEAFESFGVSVSRSAGPIKAAEKIKAAVERLDEAQKQGACFLNIVGGGRKRTAFFEVLTWAVARHPLVDSGRDGVLVHSFQCLLQRSRRLLVGARNLAFLSFHSLGRMRERSAADIFAGRSVVGMCGLVGALMGESSKHFNTEINLAFASDTFCTGVLRHEAGWRLAFFDVMTVLPRGDNERWRQAEAMLAAVLDYIKSDDADLRDYADEIAVLPAPHTDYVTRALRGGT
jgi:hypothetical protein